MNLRGRGECTSVGIKQYNLIFDVKAFWDLHFNGLFKSRTVKTCLPLFPLCTWHAGAFSHRKQHNIHYFCTCGWMNDCHPDLWVAMISWRKPLDPWSSLPSLPTHCFTFLSNIYKTCHESETVLSQYAPVRKFNTNSIHSLKWSTELKLRSTCTLLEHCIPISCHLIIPVLCNKWKFCK